MSFMSPWSLFACANKGPLPHAYERLLHTHAACHGNAMEHVTWQVRAAPHRAHPAHREGTLRGSGIVRGALQSYVPGNRNYGFAAKASVRSKPHRIRPAAAARTSMITGIPRVLWAVYPCRQVTPGLCDRRGQGGECCKGVGSLEAAQDMVNHSDPRTTKLYDRRKDLAMLSEIERRIAFE